MVKQKTAFGKMKDNMALAIGRNMSFSTKHAIEICNYLRNEKVQKAKEILEKVISKNKAIPFKRFTDGVGHKKGNLAAGRYPVNASKEILKLLKQAESNASIKGLGTEDLTIRHLVANKASTPMRYGRQIRRKTKRTHVEVIVEETNIKKISKTKQKNNTEDSSQKNNPLKNKEKQKKDEKKEILNKNSKQKNQIVNKNKEKEKLRKND